MGTIKVLSLGDVEFTPDVTRVTMGINTLHSTYNDAFEADANNTSHIKDILAEHQLDREHTKPSRSDASMHRVHKKTDRG